VVELVQGPVRIPSRDGTAFGPSSIHIHELAAVESDDIARAPPLASRWQPPPALPAGRRLDSHQMPLLRLPTTGSREQQQIRQALDKAEAHWARLSTR